MDFAKVADFEKILLHLAKLQKTSEIIQVWQKQGPRRLITDCEISNLYPQTRSFALRLTGDDQISIDQFIEHTLFARSLELEWILKSKVLLMLQDVLIAQFPEEIQVAEKRCHERLQVPDYVNLEVLLSMNCPQGKRSVSLPVSDFSASGIQVLVPKNLSRYFIEGDPLLLHRLGEEKFDNPQCGQIVRILGKRQRRQTLTALGVHLPNMLPASAFARNLERLSIVAKRGRAA